MNVEKFSVTSFSAVFLIVLHLGTSHLVINYQTGILKNGGGTNRVFRSLDVESLCMVHFLSLKTQREDDIFSPKSLVFDII